MNTRKILIGVGIVVAAAVLLGGGWLLGAHLGGAGCWLPGVGMAGRYGSAWGMHRFAGGGMFMVLIWAAILGGIALLVAGLARRGTPPSGPGDSPLEILRRRYASGEIDREEFEQAKELLSG